MPDFTDKLVPASPTGPETLAKERAGSKVPVDLLATHLMDSDGSGFLARQQRILQILLREPLCNKEKQFTLSRTERFKLGLGRAKLLRRLQDKHGWSEEDRAMAEYLVDDVSPYFLHMSMFVTTIREQASEEQRAYWMPRIERYEIIGAYAQVRKPRFDT
jgi:acyl-CoA oxidase